eukprot:scaffold136562_cov28-Attheya_sp.AAC.1
MSQPLFGCYWTCSISAVQANVVAPTSVKKRCSISIQSNCVVSSEPRNTVVEDVNISHPGISRCVVPSPVSVV